MGHMTNIIILSGLTGLYSVKVDPVTVHSQSVSSPLDVSKHLRVSQELPEVDVEHVAAGLQHDVVVVAIANSQDVGRHAAASTRVDEVLHRLDTDNSLPTVKKTKSYSEPASVPTRH